MHIILLAVGAVALSGLVASQDALAQSAAGPAPAAAEGAQTAGTMAAYTPTNTDGQIEVILKDHVFQPAEIRIPPNKAVQLLVKNQDATADEFDSTALRIEKVIGGGSQGIVRLHPLAPGRYPFMGEFHAETAQGVVIVE